MNQSSERQATIQSRNRTLLGSKLESHLTWYAAAVSAAGISMLACPSQAAGKVIYTPAHDKLQYGAVRPIDLNHDHVTDFTLVTGWRYSREWLQICDHSIRQTYSLHQYSCTYKAGVPNAAIRIFSTTSHNKREFPAALRKGDTIGKGQRHIPMASITPMCPP